MPVDEAPNLITSCNSSTSECGEEISSSKEDICESVESSCYQRSTLNK